MIRSCSPNLTQLFFEMSTAKLLRFLCWCCALCSLVHGVSHAVLHASRSSVHQNLILILLCGGPQGLHFNSNASLSPQFSASSFLPIISPFFFYQPVELFSLMCVKNLFPKVAQCSRDKTELPVSPEIYSAHLYPTIDTVHTLYHWIKPGVAQATYKRLHPPFIESVFKMLLQCSAQDNVVIPQKLWTCRPYIFIQFWLFMELCAKYSSLWLFHRFGIQNWFCWRYVWRNLQLGPKTGSWGQITAEIQNKYLNRLSHWTTISVGSMGWKSKGFSIFVFSTWCNISTWPSEWIALLCLSRHEFAFGHFSSYSVPTLIWIVNEVLVAPSMNSYLRCCLVKLCSEDMEADKEREGGWTVVSGWLFFQYKVNKSQPVIRPLGLGKVMEAFQ